MRETFPWKEQRRIIIKIGSRVLLNKENKPDWARMRSLVSEIASLKHQGYELVVVSSGAIAVGMQELGLTQRPKTLPEIQMAAAIGQTLLTTHYQRLFSKEGCAISQILLTHDDLKNRHRHLNARNTLYALLERGIIPIINENDVISVEEIQFGDNDFLAGLLSLLIQGDLLVLMTSIDGLRKFSSSGRSRRIPYLKGVSQSSLSYVQTSENEYSKGGMQSKLQVALKIGKMGIPTAIIHGKKRNMLQKLLQGEDVGTLILPKEHATPLLKQRKQWIAYFQKPTGALIVDEGAAQALLHQQASLLPAGICTVEGEFSIGSCVSILDKEKRPIATGLSNYSSTAIRKIQGMQTSKIRKILGEVDYLEVVHRDNMAPMDEVS